VPDVRIGIEAATWANKRGFGRFLRQLTTHLARRHPQHEISLVIDHHAAAEGAFPDGVRLVVVRTSEQTTRAASADSARRPADMWRISRAISTQSFDVFFFPTRYTFVPLFCRTPTVVAFHDATPERHPDLIFPRLLPRTLWRIKTRLALWRADQLVTVSEDARRQIAEAFGRPLDSIRVVTEGPDPVFRPLDLAGREADLRARWKLPAAAPLLLYVGGISPHKNLDGLLRALHRLRTRGLADWHLVLVGDLTGDSFLGCHAELTRLAMELGLADRVTFTGYVPDEDLVGLYNVATLFVLPSMGEGFGLPAVEAMACGLPVAVSRGSSLPEVVGDAGVVFDPTSQDDMAYAVGSLLADGPRRRALREKGLERAKVFSWDVAADRTMAILEEVARRG
jgi:glycosyltransferase involved in cell wall biosynthesis